MAASVWIKVWVVPSVISTSRLTAEITPVVTDCPYPRALPIAITGSPTTRSSESPIAAILIASAVAKFGSPLTSTANQLVLTTYPSDLTRKVFVKWYLIAEVGFLAWLGGVALMVIYL